MEDEESWLYGDEGQASNDPEASNDQEVILVQVLIFSFVSTSYAKNNVHIQLILHFYLASEDEQAR